MTPQQIYDTVYDALVAQGRASVASDNRCLYRGPNNLKCAVGHLIPDSLYNPATEHQPVEDIPLPENLQPHLRLLSALQRAHDRDLRHDGVPGFKASMISIAISFNLKPRG